MKPLAIFLIGFFYISIYLHSPILAQATEKRIITLSTTGWEPYSGEKLPEGGIIAAITREAFLRAGYGLKILWVPWARAMELARKGEVDGVLGAWYTNERAEQFVFTDPYFKNEIVVFKRTGEKIDYSTVESLRKYKIGVGRDSGPHALLKKFMANNLILTTNLELNLKMLLKKRFDLLIDERLGILHVLNNKLTAEKENIEILEPPIQINNLHNIFSKKIPNHKEIVADFNRSFKMLIKDGTIDQLMVNYGFDS